MGVSLQNLGDEHPSRVLTFVVDMVEAQLSQMFHHCTGAVEGIVDAQLAGGFACSYPRSQVLRTLFLRVYRTEFRQITVRSTKQHVAALGTEAERWN